MDAVDRFLRIKQDRDAKQKTQDEEVQAEADRAMRCWLRRRLDRDFADVNGFFWDYLAEDDTGSGLLRMVYRDKIPFKISGHEPTNELRVSIQDRLYKCPSSRSPQGFWTMIAEVLQARYKECIADIEKRKAKFWKSVDYQNWSIATLYRDSQEYEWAKSLLQALADDLTDQEWNSMDLSFSLATYKIENLARRAKEACHCEAVDRERTRRVESRDKTWLRVRKERLQLALFYPFVYYQVYYGTGEDDYVVSRLSDPIKDDWYDDLNSSGGQTRIPNVVKVERIVVDSLSECKYKSWCLHEWELGAFHTAPLREHGFETIQPAYPGGHEWVNVTIGSGYLWSGEELVAYEPVPLVPGQFHAPWSWLEKEENERGLMLDLDDFAEQCGFFVPETLQEWASIIKMKGVAFREDLDRFLELCGFDRSEIGTPPEMEGWNG